MSHKRCIDPRLFLFVIASLVLGGWSAADTPPSLDERVASLVERLEEKREAHHVPGMAVVVVKDGDVILSRGFGATDLENRDPVTAETLFMIGSTTKAFTSTLVGMMVDAGKMDWDEPIATYLPYFDPKVDSEDGKSRVTVRDALSHRSGFSRMSGLLTAQDMPPRDVLEVANRAEPFDEYRRAFHYNNIMYLASGTAAGEVAGSDWHELVRKRIFKPLGMKASSTRSGKTKGTLHPGYAWVEELDKHDPQPILSIEVGGPAGSIGSNAEDMGRWLQFLLADGKVGKKRLVRADTLGETWTPNIDIAGGVSYGMGWMLREWEGRRIVEHGGNILGFGAAVALMPEENLGFALMTNLTATPLQQESLVIVWDALLGEPAEEVSAAAAEDLTPYLGDYVADFASFQDVTFTVTEKGGVLFVDVPGQTNYELKPSNEDGRRPFAVTDTIAVSFEAAEDGAVNMMRMHQGGLDFELPRRGVEFPVEVDPTEFSPYLGTYRSEQFQADITARIKNNRLALDIPGQMAFELHLPDENGRRRFRIREKMSVTFDIGDGGKVASVTLRRGDELVEEMPRVGDPSGEPLPTLDAIFAVRATAERREAMAATGPVKVTGPIRFVHAGLTGTSIQWFDGERIRTDLEFGKFGWMRVTLTPDGGQMLTSVTPLDELEGRHLMATRQGLMLVQELDWREAFEKVQVLKLDEIEGTGVVVIRVENPGAPAMTAYVDPQTGDLLRHDMSMPIPGANQEIPVTTYLEDYREVEGLRVPFRTIVENQESGRTVVEVERFETGVKVCDALFSLAGSAACPG